MTFPAAKPQAAPDRRSLHVHVSGIVQGVGFRPFVYALARRYALDGWVRNTSAGVDIALDGESAALDAFTHALQAELPALARIDDLTVSEQPLQGFDGFEIIASQPEAGAFQPISPDMSLCADCRRELFDPADRRYRYPFINCTNCGPRFTIIQDLPYDRPKTTMVGFPLCAACAAEYADPLDRRFHAQPVACAACGPQVWLELPGGERLAQGEAAIQAVQARLCAGQIIAVKGLGGFHLACDATQAAAVAELRRRKLRVGKPFALMLADLEQVQAHCAISPLEQDLLASRQRPIVVVRRRADSSIAEDVAPGQSTIGVMLPYTPLHELLLEGMPPLVMTSANLSEEPIVTDNAEAQHRLAGLADAFLIHDRPIHMRTDDSVARAFPPLRRERLARHTDGLYLLRRARGYAPDALRLPFDLPQMLAAGAELKNTFCLTRERYAFLSHHIGDLENYETLQSYQQGLAHFERLFRIQPQAIAYDLHPDYLATRSAQERACQENLPAIGVQHHHAHIAACMADNGLDGSQPLIGVSFDGTGYGADGAIWGGEFLVADYGGYRRAAHLAYVPLPGGDRAVRGPWRAALAWLHAAGIAWEADLAPVRHALAQPADLPALDVIRRQITGGVNAPLTSSMGRLFDAVAAIAGLRQEVSYEAQAAIELESLASGREPGRYPFDIQAAQGDAPIQLDARPTIRALVADVRAQTPLPLIAARFHSGVAYATVQICDQIRRQTGLKAVALSGGVWQNMFLLTLTVALLQEQGFEVYLHRQVPANDGGLALGQAMIGGWYVLGRSGKDY